MTGRRIRVATGNRGKMALLGGLISAGGLTPVMSDPGDAEDLAPVGYESAVRAKVAGVLAAEPESDWPVVAHDSGFEFECLDGAPGPGTKAWLAQFRHELTGLLVPGSAVRVVHWAALWTGSEVVTFHAYDERRVPGDIVLADSALPLSDAFSGPREALSTVMARVTAEIRTGGTA